MKFLGGLLILLATVSSVFFYEKKQKYLIMELKEIKRFVDYISNRIEHLSLSLDEIYSSYNVTDKNLVLLSKKQHLGIFGDDTEEELFSCFNYLGSGYKSDELKRLAILSGHLDTKITEYEKNYLEKIKVFRAIAFFIGISIVILLI